MSKLWSITTYFNPCHYRSRSKNYAEFRKHLQSPLITVELTFDGRYELGPNDADILIQLCGTHVMWQKERLLNIGLQHLPNECDAVAWLDADILFSESRWPDLVMRALEKSQLIQPFSTSRDMLNPATRTLSDPAVSYAAAVKRGTSQQLSIQYDRNNLPVKRNYAPGFSWAARRDLIAEHMFYDTCILGGGDRAMVRAGMDRIEEEIRFQMPGEGHADHYRRWAVPFNKDVNSRIDFVPGEIVHLWHGDLKDRQYLSRFNDFPRFDFDPVRDIRLNSENVWRWSSNKKDLHTYAQNLFLARKEDGNR